MPVLLYFLSQAKVFIMGSKEQVKVTCRKRMKYVTHVFHRLKVNNCTSEVFSTNECLQYMRYRLPESEGIIHRSEWQQHKFLSRITTEENSFPVWKLP